MCSAAVEPYTLLSESYILVVALKGYERESVNTSLKPEDLAEILLSLENKTQSISLNLRTKQINCFWELQNPESSLVQIRRQGSFIWNSYFSTHCLYRCVVLSSTPCPWDSYTIEHPLFFEIWDIYVKFQRPFRLLIRVPQVQVKG